MKYVHTVVSQNAVLVERAFFGKGTLGVGLPRLSMLSRRPQMPGDIGFRHPFVKSRGDVPASCYQFWWAAAVCPGQAADLRWRTKETGGFARGGMPASKEKERRWRDPVKQQQQVQRQQV